MATFTWTPDRGLKGKGKPRVLAVAYGDGYEQRVGDGINNNPRTYNLQFTLLNATVFGEIMAFLEARGGKEAFDWTPPGRSAGRFICEEWDDDTDGVTYSVTATFRQVYGV